MTVRNLWIPKLWTPPSITGVTHYVKTGGDDGKDGLSDANAWATVGKVNGHALSAGDAVLFKASNTFSDAELDPVASGTAGNPILYGTYGGPGKASIPKNVWFTGKNYLTFDNLILGTEGNMTFQGGNAGAHSNFITIQRCWLRYPVSTNTLLGIMAFGDDWKILGTTITAAGDSAVQMTGDRCLMQGCTVAGCAYNAALGYGKHGIYLNGALGTVLNNVFVSDSANSDSAVSQRYHGATVANNRMIGWVHSIYASWKDTVKGTSRWTANECLHPSAACFKAADETQSLNEDIITQGNLLMPGLYHYSYDWAANLGSYTSADIEV